VKKFVFPGIMAFAGIFAIFIVFTNVTSSTSTSLSAIRVGDGTTFTDVKAGDTYELPTGTIELTVEATPVDPLAEVSVTGNTDFKPGNNTLTITVKGSDGKSSTDHTLTLVKPKLAGWCEGAKYGVFQPYKPCYAPHASHRRQQGQKGLESPSNSP
jgi:hypothetical protein